MNWEYIAGFFDGEGNFQIHPIKTATGKTKAYQLLVRIYSTNKNVLERIKEFIKVGGIYTKRSRVKTNPTRNLLYELTITKMEDCLYFLKNILPHLIIKKDQLNYLLKNFIFSRNNNLSFDLDKFRSFNTRANTAKFIKNHTIKTPNVVQPNN